MLELKKEDWTDSHIYQECQFMKLTLLPLEKLQAWEVIHKGDFSHLPILLPSFKV